MSGIVWLLKYDAARRAWQDTDMFTPSADLSFAQQIGQNHGVGRYLMLGDDWQRELTVESTDTHYREAA